VRVDSFVLQLSILNLSVEVGEVWANTLHNVYAALVSQYGWSSVAKTNPEGSEGNIVYLHLFIDALRLQPCNPNCKPSIALFVCVYPDRCLQLSQHARHGFKLMSTGMTVPTSVCCGRPLLVVVLVSMRLIMSTTSPSRTVARNVQKQNICIR